MEKKQNIYSTYDIVLTKKVGTYNSGDVLFFELDSQQLASFLGKNNHPFGFCGNSGDVPFVASKEIMDNIKIIQKTRITKLFTKTLKINDFL